jgi:hypothetical protein
MSDPEECHKFAEYGYRWLRTIYLSFVCVPICLASYSPTRPPQAPNKTYAPHAQDSAWLMPRQFDQEAELAKFQSRKRAKRLTSNLATSKRRRLSPRNKQKRTSEKQIVPNATPSVLARDFLQETTVSSDRQSRFCQCAVERHQPRMR